MSNDPREILAKLDSVESKRDPNITVEPRRAYRRHTIRGEAKLTPVSRRGIDAPPIDIQLRDVCRAGVGFLATQSFSINSHWRIDFLNQGFTAATMDLIIRHNNPIANGLFLVGANFVIPTATLLHLGVSLDQIESDITNRDAQDFGNDSFVAPGEVA